MIPIEQHRNRRDFIERVLVLILFLALLLTLFDVLKVFFGILTFGLIFSVSFYHVFEKVTKLARGRKNVATIIYIIILIALLLIPFIFLISSLTIGLTIAHIPFALSLSALIFFLVMLQIGPLFVWIPVLIWTALTGITVFLIAYGVILSLLDAILKPIFIAKSGGKYPFWVIFIGVIEGLAALVFKGMFKSAIIMSVFYTVFTSWLERKKLRFSINVNS